jgi:hypothetical protein
MFEPEAGAEWLFAYLAHVVYKRSFRGSRCPIIAAVDQIDSMARGILEYKIDGAKL